MCNENVIIFFITEFINIISWNNIIIIFVFFFFLILLFIFRKILFKRKRVILYNNDFNSQTDFKINDKEFIDDFNIKDKGGKVKIELSDKQSESNTLF